MVTLTWGPSDQTILIPPGTVRAPRRLIGKCGKWYCKLATITEHGKRIPSQRLNRTKVEAICHNVVRICYLNPIMAFWISFAENSRTKMVMGPSSRTFLRLKQCASLHATFILIVVVGSKNATLELRICAFEFLTISVGYDVQTTSWFLQRTLLLISNELDHPPSFC